MSASHVHGTPPEVGDSPEFPGSPVTQYSKPLPHSIPRSVALAVFLLAAGALSIIYSILWVKQNTHAGLVYLLFLHVLVLPALIWYWRLSRNTQPSFAPINTYLLTAVAFSILIVLVGLSTQNGRLIVDESAYRFQARVFTAGKLKATPMYGVQPDIRRTPDEIFFVHTLQTPGGWYAKYPPAWPLVLAAGYLFHCTWLINPLCGIVQLFLIWWLARPWGHTTQIIAVVIASTSAYMLVSNVGYMSHPFEAVVALVVIGLLLKGVKSARLQWIALCFALVIVGIQIRLYTGAVLGVLCTGILLYEFKAKRRLLLGSLSIAFAAALISVILYLAENRLYTGDALLSPYSVYAAGNHFQEFTFNPLRILPELHIWRWALAETARVMFPFLFLLAAFACWKQENNKRYLVYLSLLFPLLVLSYLAEQLPSGSFDGERYYYEGFCLLAIVAARGFDLLVKNWGVESRSVNVALFVLIAIQVPTIIFTAKDIQQALRLYKQAYQLSISAPTKPLVFLSSYPSHFASKQINWNAANWQQAQVVFLNDPGSARRDSVACRFGRPSYRLVQFDPKHNQMIGTDAVAACSAARAN